MTRVLYLDLVGGAAGDMLMAALVDAGASLERIRSNVDALCLEQVEVRATDTTSSGLRACRIDVIVRGELADQDHAHHDDHHDHHDHHHHLHRDHHHHPTEHSKSPGVHRAYREIRARLERASLPSSVKTRALRAFELLAEGEAMAHGIALEDVVFHEVGADDALVDVVGVCTAIDELAPNAIVASPVPVGRGLVRGAHGPIPLPGPAALCILRGVPLETTSLTGETVTPTGAALLRTIVERFGPVPAMTVHSIGVGAGHRAWPDRPNVVRALVGLGAGESSVHAEPPTGDHVVVETNLDDMHPQHLPALENALFLAGATDVWLQPVHMKKGRMGVMVSALVRHTLVDAIAQAFFDHSTTFGVRIVPVTRICADRRIEEVRTKYGNVRVKIRATKDARVLVMPEHDDCARLAAEIGCDVRAVWEEAILSARR